MSRQQLQTISRLPHLQRLELNDAGPQGAKQPAVISKRDKSGHPAAFEPFTSLTSLLLSRSSRRVIWTPADFHSLVSLRNLRVLVVTLQPDNFAYHALLPLTHLASLEIPALHPRLTQLRQLLCLSLTGSPAMCGPGNGMQASSAITTHPVSPDFASLARLSSLTLKNHCCPAGISSDLLESFTVFGGLQHLTLHVQLSDYVWSGLTSLRQIRPLELRQQLYDSSTFAMISDMTQLTSLQFYSATNCHSSLQMPVIYFAHLMNLRKLMRVQLQVHFMLPQDQLWLHRLLTSIVKCPDISVQKCPDCSQCRELSRS